MVSGTVYIDTKKKRWVALGVRKTESLSSEFIYTYLTLYNTYDDFRIFSMDDDMLKDLIKKFLYTKTDVIKEENLSKIFSIEYLHPFHYVLTSDIKAVDKIDLTSYFLKNKLLGKQFNYYSDTEIKTFKDVIYQRLKEEQKSNEYQLSNIFNMYYKPVDSNGLPLYYHTKENTYYKYSKKEKMYYPVYFVKSTNIKDILCARQKIEGKKRLAKRGKSIPKDEYMLGCMY